MDIGYGFPAWHRGAKCAVWRATLIVMIGCSVIVAPPGQARADNTRLNKSVRQMVNILQYKAGCPDYIQANHQLELAAQWHARDVLNSRWLDGDTGSDGSSPSDRAAPAGYHGHVEQTVAINPALAISSLELIKQWYHNPHALAIMQNCANSEIGVWSENSLDRTVVVAVYGQPATEAL